MPTVPFAFIVSPMALEELHTLKGNGTVAAAGTAVGIGAVTAVAAPAVVTEGADDLMEQVQPPGASR